MHVELQIMSREIGFLQEELKSLEGVQVQSASGCCKEVDEYVGMNPDPIVPVNGKRRGSCGVLRWLSAKLCFNFSCFCCSSGSSVSSESSSCKCRHIKNLGSFCHCGSPCSSDCCCQGFNGCRKSCNTLSILCPEVSCGCVWSCSKCTEVHANCPGCRKTCCISHCIC
ncbi:hypothetical protein J5N97_005894 [Dioscorea zingiberensis]|uniref:Anaphylatoxin-like domain-containing protein n=1 Tax=Dioscorea zingiberensis TaxID=325984 RepID=A0A9D5D973_9LILI|nr:hypothetical protein J5N97_005894 [Dioscorea zingiberensis]